MGFLIRCLHAHHDIAIHLDEATVAIPGEAGIAGNVCQTFNGDIVQAQVENGVHHARHGVPRAGAHGDEQRIVLAAEGLLHLRFHQAYCSLHIAGEGAGIAAIMRIEIGAHFRADGETRGHRQADRSHLGEVGTLAAQQLAHAGIAVCLTTEVVNVGV